MSCNKPNGTNSFRRSVADNRGDCSATDAMNVDSLGVINQEPSTTIETQNNGQTFSRLLPTRRHDYTDRKQLKSFPQFRLISDTTQAPTQSGTPTTTANTSVDAGFAHGQSDSLNPDVTEFLALLNDVGLRIYRYLDQKSTGGSNFGNIVNFRGIAVTNNKLNMDSISSNIIRGIDDIRKFLFRMGKKVAPPSSGFNPYFNNDHTQVNTLNSVVNNTSGDNIRLPTAPYHPDDVNTYINCLETLADNSAPISSDVDFNLRVFQACVENVKVSKFDDSMIDCQMVTRSVPNHSVMRMIMELLKIDTKFFSILHQLNMHNAFRSPITGVFYGKRRTKINENGIPVLNNEVTNVDIHNATVQMKDLISSVLKMITFVDPESFNRIMMENFGIDSILNGAGESAKGVDVSIGDTALNINGINTGNVDNIPCFLYGHILSFCDAARQVVSEENLPFPSAPENAGTTFNDNYEPSKVAGIAVNCIHGMHAIMEIIESFFKSSAYASVMAFLFPSQCFHDSAPRSTFGNRIELDRMHMEDLHSISKLSIEGQEYNLENVVPSSSLPNVHPCPTISINRLLFCDMIVCQAGISNLLYDSGAPIINPCEFRTLDVTDPNDDFEFSDIGETVPTTTSTTTTTTTTTTKCPPKCSTNSCGNTCSCPKKCKYGYKYGDQMGCKCSYCTYSYSKCNYCRDVNNNNGRSLKSRANEEQESFTVPEDVNFLNQELLKYLIENKHRAVLTDNCKLIVPFECYIQAFCECVQARYNARAKAALGQASCKNSNRNVFDMLTNGLKM